MKEPIHDAIQAMESTMTPEQIERSDAIYREEMAKTSLAASFEVLWGAVSKGVHQTAIAKGWWDKPRSDGEVLVLVHAEISEAVESLRNGNPPDNHCPEFTGVEVELADAIIRIMDYGAFKGLRIGEAIMAKIEYNKGRPMKHGKEF